MVWRRNTSFQLYVSHLWLHLDLSVSVTSFGENPNVCIWTPLRTCGPSRRLSWPPCDGLMSEHDPGLCKESVTPFPVRNAIKGTYYSIFWVTSNRGPRKERGQDTVKERVEQKPQSDCPSRLCDLPQVTFCLQASVSSTGIRRCFRSVVGKHFLERFR